MELEIESRETALLVIDMQNDYVHENGLGAKHGSTLWKCVKEGNVVENISRIIKAARAVKMPVFHVRVAYRKDLADMHDKSEPAEAVEGTWGCDFVKELQPEESDYVITKKRGSAFYGTDLELLLRCRGIHAIIATGIATDHCVDATVRSALDRDFRVTVVSDATATNSKEVQDYLMKKVFPELTTTMTTDEVIEILKKAKA